MQLDRNHTNRKTIVYKNTCMYVCMCEHMCINMWIYHFIRMRNGRIMINIFLFEIAYTPGTYLHTRRLMWQLFVERSFVTIHVHMYMNPVKSIPCERKNISILIGPERNEQIFLIQSEFLLCRNSEFVALEIGKVF